MNNKEKNTTCISVRQMSRLLRRLHIGDGDILALKHGSENANRLAIETITRALEHLSINVLVIVVNDFDDLTVLNEREMNKRGWYHMSQMQKLIGGKASDKVQ